MAARSSARPDQQTAGVPLQKRQGRVLVDARGSSWLLFSWPDFSVERVRAYASPFAIAETDPFHFVWDITARVKAGKNTVSFRHDEIATEAHLPGASRRPRGGRPAARVGQSEHGRHARSGRRFADVRPARAATGPDARGVEPREVEYGRSDPPHGRRADAECHLATSEPAGRWATTGKEAWQPISPGTSGKAEWSCRGYRVTRTVAVRGDHLHVTDTFSNAGDRLVGVMCDNRLALDVKPVETRLAGRPPYTESQIESAGRIRR